MILLTYGSPRSGSTWLFNVVRRSLTSAEIPFKWAVVSEPGIANQKELDPEQSELVVLKSHRLGDTEALRRLVEEGLARVLVSSRETTSQLQSLRRIRENNEKKSAEVNPGKGVADLKRRTAAEAAELLMLRPYLAVQEFHMRNKPERAVKDVSRFLGLRLSRFDLREIAEEFSVESVAKKISLMSENNGWKGTFKEYDRETHWHANHIGQANEWEGLDFSAPEVRALVDDAEEVRRQLTGHSSRKAGVDLYVPSEDHFGRQLKFLTSPRTEPSSEIGQGGDEPNSPPPAQPRNLESQKGQVRFLLENVFNYAEVGLAREGFFVDLAAGHPTTHSNTWFLETFLDWKGILIEPNPRFAELLREQRTASVVEKVIAAEDDVSVPFRIDNGMLGGIVGDEFDNYPKKIENAEGKTEVVALKTQTLHSVLESCGAPAEIDYLSLDVEGAEWECLRSFPFSRWRFRALTIERMPLNLALLLDANGYIQVAHEKHDTFLVHRDFLDSMDREGLNPRFWIGPPKARTEPQSQ